MHFSTSITYPAAAADVSRLWRDESFHLAKAERVGAIKSTISVQGDDDLTITLRSEIPSDLLPPAARRFVGASLNLTIVEAWQAADDSGRRSGTLSLNIAGAPVRVRAQLELIPLGESECTRTIDGSVNASVPLFSGPIERAAVRAMDDVIAAEKAIAIEFLSRS